MSALFNFFNTFGATRLTLPAVEAELIMAVPCSHAHYVVLSPSSLSVSKSLSSGYNSGYTLTGILVGSVTFRWDGRGNSDIRL